MKFLYELLYMKSISGDESSVSSCLLNYIFERKSFWKVAPEVFFGKNFQDCIVLKFGNPRTAIFAHIDTIGFMSRYENQLIPVGGPEIINGTEIEGEDSLGPIKCKIFEADGQLFHDFPRAVDRGTCFSFTQNLKIDNEFISAAYLDNRLGIYNALEVCETLEDGWVVFSTYEEHGGGSVPFLLKFIQETSPINQALISDITWITDGVSHHHGVVISMRDKMIPRRSFLNRITQLAKKSGVDYQLEVEAYGGSDGREIQFSPYAIDWCFVGAAEDNVHTPNEKVSLKDLNDMINMYRYLMKHL